MAEQENKKYRAVNFDLSEKKLKKFYSATNPKGAYGKISDFFEKRNFEHRQYSGYRSKEPMTDIEIMDLMDELFTKMPWLDKCAEKMDITNIESVYDVLQIRKEERAEAIKHFGEKGLDKETKPKEPISMSDMIAQKKALISQRESKIQSHEKHKSSEIDLS